MGIGRAAFLKFLGIALGGLIIDPLNAVALNGNAYINKKIGLIFYKPNDWDFVAVKDFGKLKKAQIIGEDIDLNADEIWNDLGDPICVITKYCQDLPSNKGIFSPTITVQITAKEEIQDEEEVSFKELIGMSLLGVSTILKDFKVLKEHEPYSLSGVTFYEFDSEYLFEHIDISKPLKVELKTLKAEHNGFYYDFNCHQSNAQNQLAGKEFEEFKKSIKLL